MVVFERGPWNRNALHILFGQNDFFMVLKCNLVTYLQLPMGRDSHTFETKAKQNHSYDKHITY